MTPHSTIIGRRPAARKGFTLIELILYIGITATVVVALLRVMFTVLETRQEVENVSIVQQELRLAMDRMTTTVLQAVAVNSGASIFGAEQGALSLALAEEARNPTIFSLSGGQIVVTAGERGALPLTSPHVMVAELRFTNLTASGTIATVHVRIHAMERNATREPQDVLLETSLSLRR